MTYLAHKPFDAVSNSVNDPRSKALLKEICLQSKIPLKIREKEILDGDPDFWDAEMIIAGIPRKVGCQNKNVWLDGSYFQYEDEGIDIEERKTKEYNKRNVCEAHAVFSLDGLGVIWVSSKNLELSPKIRKWDKFTRQEQDYRRVSTYERMLKYKGVWIPFERNSKWQTLL